MKRSRQQTDSKPTENAAAWDAPGDGEPIRPCNSSEPRLSDLQEDRKSYSWGADNRPISKPARMLTLKIHSEIVSVRASGVLCLFCAGYELEWLMTPN